MAIDLVVRNGTFVTGKSSAEASIGIVDGKIAVIASDAYMPEANQTIDASGLTILPGVIDVHIHTRDPGFTHLEDFETASRAAAAGGVTMVIDMPQTDEPVLCNLEAFENKLRVLKDRAYVDFGLRGSIVPDQLAEVPRLAEAGVVGFKVQMSHSVRSKAVDDGTLYRSFQLVAEADRPIGVHAENEGLTTHLSRELRDEGRSDALAHYESRPNLAEEEAIQRAICFCRHAGNRLHIHHMTSKRGAELLSEAKSRGLPVTGETCPHYLLFDTEDYVELGSILKMNPSIKTPEDREALWEALRVGTIDIVASDHAPHSQEEKIQDNIWEAVAGFAGVETMVPLMLTAVNQGQISLEQYVQMSSERPAQVFGIFPRKGSIAVGSDADLTIVAVEKAWTIDTDKLQSKTTTSPYDGQEVVGAPMFTIVRGNVVAREGEVVGSPTGRLVRP